MSKKPLLFHIPVGIPGSGKSTWAHEIVDKDRHARVVCRDSIRECLFGVDYKFSKHREGQVSIARADMVKQCAEDPYCTQIIIDETHCSQRMRSATNSLIEDIKKMYPDRQIDTVVHVMEDSFNVDLCHKRNAARTRTVPYEVIERMFVNFIDYVRNNPSHIRDYNWLPDPSCSVRGIFPECVIVDIDGTIADHEGIRSPFKWEDVGKDRPKDEVIRVINRLATIYSIIIFSGRDGVCRPETEEWLKDKGVKYDHLYMRPEGDSRKDYIIKMELYRDHIQNKYRCRGVFDDRMQVVRYWRAIGLTCFQVDLGMF